MDKKSIVKRLIAYLLVLSLVLVPVEPVAAAGTVTLKSPVVSIKNDAKGVQVSWKKVTGAAGYRIYKKEGKNYKRIASGKSCFYRDTKVVSGKSYSYKIVAYQGSRTKTSKVMSIRYLAMPKVTVKNTISGVQITWKKIKGAETYRVYYKKGNSWKRLTETKKTSVVDTQVSSGEKRTYTVKAMSGKTGSGFCSGKSIRYLAAPKVTMTDKEQGLQLTWKPVKGASYYRVYQKSGNSWKRLIETKKNSFFVKGLKNGQKGVYTVRAFGNDTSSAFDTYKHTYVYTHTHEWRLKEVEQEMDCLHDGVVHYTCKGCGALHTNVIPSTGHDWDITENREAACTEDGVHSEVCKNCGEKKTKQFPATGHDWESAKKVDADCTTNGMLQSVCKNCGEEKIEILPATGNHDWKLKSEQKASCEADGCRIWQCTVCGREKTESIPKTGHTWQVTESVEASCETDGYQKLQCESCRKTKTETISSAGAHIYKEVSRKEAVCEQDGAVYYRCSACGMSKTEAIPALKHDWTVERVIAATCGEEGKKIYRCSRCRAEKTEPIAATGRHDWVEAARVDAACEEDGEVIYTCMTCEQTKTEPLKASGVHIWEETAYVEADCHTDGYREETCVKCGKKQKTVLPKTGNHVWEEQTEEVWMVDQEAYEEEVLVEKKYYHRCTNPVCQKKFYFDKNDQESNNAAVDAWFAHSCPGGERYGYTTDSESVYETVYHEEKGHYETHVTGYRCSVCGETKSN